MYMTKSKTKTKAGKKVCLEAALELP